MPALQNRDRGPTSPIYVPKIIEICDSLAENTQVEYEDIFGTTNKQVKAIELFEKIHEARDKLIYENNL